MRPERMVIVDDGNQVEMEFGEGGMVARFDPSGVVVLDIPDDEGSDT